MLKNKFHFFIILGFLSLSLLSVPSVRAAECNDYTQLNLVARDPDGVYIPSIKAELYHQVPDADGQPKPGSKVASANSNVNTGVAALRFRNSAEQSAVYALRVQTITKEAASFWYYDINLACGEELDLEEVLSGIYFVLRDYNGDLLYNTNFNLYTQRYDVDGKPVKEKKDLIITGNTGSTGGTRAYVPRGSVRSIGRTQSDHYVFELIRGGKYFTFYDIEVQDKELSEVDYRASAIKVTLRTALGALFPGKTKVEVYKQIIDDNNDQAKGDKVGEFQTNDDGYGIFEYPEGVYVLSVKNSNGEYDYLWDTEIKNSQLDEYEWLVGANWQAGNETCQSNSKLFLNLLSIGGEVLEGFKYEIYEQSTDALGRLVAGKKVGGGSTSAGGKAEFSLKPDPRQSYALKIYDKKTDLGEFWFFDAVRFVCGVNRTVTKNLPYLKIVLRDGNGNLKKNTSFSIYEQIFDADNKPVKDESKLIDTLKTGSNGSALLYLAPAHPFNQNRRGLYVFSATVGKSIFNVYDIAMPVDRNLTFEYVFSDLSLNVKSAAGKASAGKELKLYSQVKKDGVYALDSQLSSGKTDVSGNLQLEYPAGNYAVVIADSLGRNNIFWNITIKDRQANHVNLNLNVTRLSLNGSLGELVNNSSLTIYSLYENNGGFYKDKELGTVKLSDGKPGELWLADGPYLATYTDKAKNEYGQAFWAQNGEINIVKVKADKTQQITAGQRFKLSKPAAANTPVVPTGGQVSISRRLAGYILLQTEDKGQAWYVNPKTLKRHYLADGSAAYNIMRQAGVGITDADLRKIPIGVDSRFAKNDSDGDLLPDGLEVAIGSNPQASDSDKDGFLDGEELRGNFNPAGLGNMPIDTVFANKQKGKILLQVQKNGEAWYVNPKDGKRYYLGDGGLAFQIMRYLSLGVNNKDLSAISVGQ